MAKLKKMLLLAFMAVMSVARAQDVDLQPVPALNSFEEGLEGWTIGNQDSKRVRFGSRSGSHCLMLGSMDGSSVWALSAPIALPDADSVDVAIYAKTASLYGQGLALSVAVLTGSADVDNPLEQSTLLQTFPTSLSAYAPCQVSLSQYAGDTVRLLLYTSGTAIGSSLYNSRVLLIDDVSLFTRQAPFVIIEGNNYAFVGQPLQLTAHAEGGDSASCNYVWEDRSLSLELSEDVSITGLDGETITITWAEAGHDTVILNTDNNYGEHVARLPITVYDCSQIDDFPYEEHFDYNRLNCMKSPSGQWQVNADEGDWQNGVASCTATSGGNAANMLITPLLHIDDTALEFSWTASAYSLRAGIFDKSYYRVLVSTGTSLSSFNELASYQCLVSAYNNTSSFYDTCEKPAPQYGRINIGNNYVGLDVYLAFEYVSTDVSDFYYTPGISTYFQIDGVRVGSPLPPRVKAHALTPKVRRMAGQTVSFKAITATSLGYTLSWDFGPNATVSTHGDTADVVFSQCNTGYNTYTVTITDAHGRSNSYTDSVYMYDCQPFSDFPYVEDFDNDDMNCWKSIRNYGVYVINGYVRVPNNSPIASQEMVLPASGQLELSWRCNFIDYYQSDGKMLVLVSTTGRNSYRDFTDTLLNITPETNAWCSYRLSLSRYAGQTVNIAFATYGSSASMEIDDIRIDLPGPPCIESVGPDTVYQGRLATLKAKVSTSLPITSYAWSLHGATVMRSDSLSVTADFDNLPEGYYTYSYTVCNASGCDTLTDSVWVKDCSTPVTTYPYTVELGPDCTDICWAGEGWIKEYVNMVGYMSSVITEGEPNTLYGRLFQFQNRVSYEIEWTVRSGGGCVYAVVIDDGTTVDTIFSEELSASMFWLTRRTLVPVPAGREGRIDVVHISGSQLSVSSIGVKHAAPPEVAILAPLAARTGQPVTLKADIISADTNLNYLWRLPSATPDSATTGTVQAVWNTPGNYEVTLTISTMAGSSVATHNINIATCNTDAVIDFPYTEDFDEGVICFSTIDDDGDGNNWESLRNRYIFAGMGGQVQRLTQNGSTDAAVSWSALPGVPYPQGNLNANNYLVTPSIALPGDVPMTLTFSTRTVNMVRPENLTVKLSNMSPSIAHLRNTLLPTTAIIDTVYSKYDIDLEGYAGYTVYIAFQHTGNGGSGLLIDDVSIHPTSNTAVAAADVAEVLIAPNPLVGSVLTVSAPSLQQVQVLDVSGRVVATGVAAEGAALALPAGHLPAGIYMVRVLTAQGVAVRKLVKQ